MGSGETRSLCKPGARALRLYLLYGLVIDLLFLIVYGGANWLTSRRGDLYHLYFPWELSIPFRPEMIWGYLSMFPLFLLPLWQLDYAGLKRLGHQIMLGILLAGAVYLLLPAELGFPRHQETGAYQGIFDLIHLLDYPHNLVPSLHILFSMLILWAMWEAAGRGARWIYGGWLLLISVSVVLVHQHHLLDVIGGYLLAIICRKLLSNKKKIAPKSSAELG